MFVRWRSNVWLIASKLIRGQKGVENASPTYFDLEEVLRRSINLLECLLP